MSRATVTVDGYTAEPRRNTTGSGREVVTVAVGHTPRKKGQSGWEDAGPTVWFEAAFWDGEADQIVKGQHVTLTGQPELNLFKGRDGETKASIRVRFAVLAVVQDKQQPEQPADAGDAWGAQNPGAPF